MSRKKIAEYVTDNVAAYFTSKNFVLNKEIELHKKEGRRKQALRVDLIGINSKLQVVIIEVKSSLSDFTSDKKMHLYQDYCDKFYVASTPEVCAKIKDKLPKGAGLLAVTLPENYAILKASSRRVSSSKPARVKAATEDMRQHVLFRFAFRSADYNRYKKHSRLK